MSTDGELLRDAAALYVDIEHGELAADERRDAARRFAALAARLATNDLALARAARQARDGDGEARLVAARLLVAAPDPRGARALVAAAAAAPDATPPEALAYFGLSAPLPDEAWTLFDAATTDERRHLVRALLRRSSPRGAALVCALVDDDALAEAAIAAAGDWCAPELLRSIVDGGRRAPADLPAWLARDLRVEAAFRLALRGDRAAVGALERWAAGAGDGDAANALVSLALLAWRDAVPPTAHALLGDDGALAALAIDAASALAAGALVAPLATLAARPDAPSSPDGVPLGDDARAAAAAIAGDAATLEPMHRYRGGRPLAFAALVDDLESRHTGARRRGAYNLRSMTGEHHGYEPELDFIANAPAVDAWRARVGALRWSDWMWQGTPLV